GGVLVFTVVRPSEARAGTHNHRLEWINRDVCQIAPRKAAAYGSRLSVRWCSLGRDDAGVSLRPSLRPEHELAVALQIGAGAHIELSVLADEEQGALRHFLGALQQQAG